MEEDKRADCFCSSGLSASVPGEPQAVLWWWGDCVCSLAPLLLPRTWSVLAISSASNTVGLCFHGLVNVVAALKKEKKGKKTKVACPLPWRGRARCLYGPVT